MILKLFLEIGGGEGRELTSSYKNTKITTNCETTTDKKMLEPTKKDILHPKTKKKPQQDGRRGAIAIKIFLTLLSTTFLLEQKSGFCTVNQ